MSPNEYMQRLIAAAEEQGWMVLSFSVESPGYIVLGSPFGDDTQIEIRTRYGIGTEAYIRQLTPLPRSAPVDPVSTVDAP